MGLTARQIKDQRDALLAALDAEDERLADALDEERYPSPQALEDERDHRPRRGATR